MLSLCGGNYSTSEIWSDFTPISFSSHIPSTRFPTKENSRIANAG
jgi:hypothetical protein